MLEASRQCMYVSKLIARDDETRRVDGLAQGQTRLYTGYSRIIKRRLRCNLH